MVKVIIRFAHLSTRTPILELSGIDSETTFGALRVLVEERLAAEEVGLMRVFVKWYIEVPAGGKKRPVEITDEDADSLLSTWGFDEDYKEILLEGPLTHTYEGVGQALAMVAAQVRELRLQATEIRKFNKESRLMMSFMSDNISELMKGQQRMEALVVAMTLKQFPSDELEARILQTDDEKSAFARLSLIRDAEREMVLVFSDTIADIRHLQDQERLAYRVLVGGHFTFAHTHNPHPDVFFEDAYTAVRPLSWSTLTLRSAQPLSPAHHQWAVKIIAGNVDGISLGLLPMLPSKNLDTRIGAAIGSFSGWSFYGSDGKAYGDWKCDPFPFKEGEVVSFDYNISNKSLTIRCGGRRVVGFLPPIKFGEELYPAVCLSDEGHKSVAFVQYPKRSNNNDDE